MVSRSHVSSPILPLLLLLAACSGSGDPVPEPAILQDSFEFWQSHWTPSSEFETEIPTHDTVEGELQLASAEAEEDRFAQVTLRHTGVYEVVEAMIAANSDGPDANSVFKFVLEFSLGTTKHRAVWQIGHGFATEFHVEQLDGAVLLATVIDGPTVAAGEPHTYRISIRPDDDAIDVYLDAVRWGTVELADVRFSPSASIFHRVDQQYSVAIDDFIAWDRDRLPLLELTNVQRNHQPPGLVSLLFNAQRSDGAALAIPAEELEERIGFAVREDGVDLAGAESTNLLHAAAELPLNLVLVLDYSESMEQAGGGTGIATMLEGVQAILDGLADPHRVAILEFHDNLTGDNFSTRIAFTTDKAAAWSALEGFEPFHGFSTCWDAVHQGLTLFPETVDPGVVRALVFLSDGYDGSSSNAPADLIAEATARGVRLYGIGVHPVTPLNERILEDLSVDTGGKYRAALEIAEVSSGLEGVLEDLLANYQVSYVSATAGPFQVEVVLEEDADQDGEVESFTLDPLTDDLDGAAIEGDTRRGILAFTPISVVGERVEFFIRAKYLPRDVTEIKFELPTDSVPIGSGDITVERARGPLDSWEPVAFTAGWYSSSGPELVFGDSGYLLRVVLQGVDQNFTLPVSFDNSLYANGTLLYGGDEGELVGNYWETGIEITVE